MTKEKGVMIYLNSISNNENTSTEAWLIRVATKQNEQIKSQNLKFNFLLTDLDAVFNGLY